MSPKRRYAMLDVFTDQPLSGNPLAVVLDSEGLDTAQMQAIAREFNVSETVFVAPPRDEKHRAAVRIFTPAYELPFAGHPTIGTAVYLAQQSSAGDMVLDAPVGPIHCHTENGHARFALPKLPAPVRLAGNAAQVAQALSLQASDILGAPCAHGAGNPGFALVEVTSLEALARVRVSPLHYKAAFDGLVGAFVYTSHTHDSALQFRARMVDDVIGEDPATGSAVAAFAGLLAQSCGDGAHRFAIGQGYEMQRPSQIMLELHIAGGALTTVHVSGRAVVVAEGVLFI
jgi:trans-2,3-dihydro-3-hydroxyanthranilate isomerase